MKKIIFLLLGFFIWQGAHSQTLTSIFKLKQWAAGDTLKAGTANDSTQANASLNYNFYRLETILGRYINGSGQFTQIVGAGSQLNIKTGSAHVQPVNIDDSLWVGYNLNVTLSALIGGDLTVGGTLHAASLANGITGQNMTLDTLILGSDGVNYGAIQMWDGAAGGALSTLIPPASGGFTWTLPSVTGIIATTNGDQEFTNVGTLVADSIQSPNLNYQLYNQGITDAGTSSGDTSNADGSRWQTEGATYERKAKTAYIHKTGDFYVKAYFMAAVNNIDVNSAKYKLELVNSSGTIIAADSSATSVNTSSYDNKTLTIGVSGLTNQLPYFLNFYMKHDDGATYVAYAKNLVILVQSQ